MSRINTNVGSLVAQTTLSRNNNDLQQALGRLSTGLRINSGADDPAGLIASENLRRDITSVNRAIQNSERAGQLIATADSALGQVSSLLNDIRGLVTEAANSGVLSDDQIAANQLQVDSSLEAIDRIFARQRLSKVGKLSMEAWTSLSTPSRRRCKVSTFNKANLGVTGSVLVNVDIVAEAETAQFTVAAAGFPAVGNALDDALVFQIAGADGAEVFSFAAGATIDDVADAINLVSDATGVTATVTGGFDLELDSTAYGSDAFVAVDVISEGPLGDFATNLSGTRDEGADIAATVNGVQANGRGNTLSINSATLDLSLTVIDGDNTDVSFTIEDGGAVFQLGPRSGQQSTGPHRYWQREHRQSRW